MRLRDWSSRRLFVSWVVYWGILLLVFAWRQLWRFVRLQLSDQHGSVNLSYSGSLLSLALWVAGPPLLLFVVWLATRRRQDVGRGAERPTA